MVSEIRQYLHTYSGALLIYQLVSQCLSEFLLSTFIPQSNPLHSNQALIVMDIIWDGSITINTDFLLEIQNIIWFMAACLEKTRDIFLIPTKRNSIFKHLVPTRMVGGGNLWRAVLNSPLSAVSSACRKEVLRVHTRATSQNPDWSSTKTLQGKFTNSLMDKFHVYVR